jgi:hypothetical protein
MGKLVWVPSAWPYAAILAVPVTIVFWLATTKRRTVKRYLKFCLASVGCLTALLVAIRFAHTRATHFAFIGDHPVFLKLQSDLVGMVWNVYSFPGEPDKVMDAMEAELKPQGFEITDNSPESLDAERRVGATPIGPLGYFVSVSGARATGKYWEVDGDFIRSRRRNDWVLVSVAEPDRVPWWLTAIVDIDAPYEGKDGDVDLDSKRTRP